MILCRGKRILPQHIQLGDEGRPTSVPPAASEGSKSLAEVERDHIESTLKECSWNQTRTASVLGIDRKTLRNKIREYQLGTEIAAPRPDDAAKPHQ
ncbi:MAG: hypothetical protein NTU88_04795 [Armatimonadetes bacterium]|nr:hypothetical protein [Armatimonadota bacterium]